MHHQLVTQCKVLPGKMQEFVTTVQKWEHQAMAHADAPKAQTVLVCSDAPASVIVITEFADRPTAERFVASGLMDGFLNNVMACTDATGHSSTGYDLFYRIADDGSRVVFGQDG